MYDKSYYSYKGIHHYVMIMCLQRNALGVHTICMHHPHDINAEIQEIRINKKKIRILLSDCL